MRGSLVSKSMGDLPEFREDEDDEIWGMPPSRSAKSRRRNTNSGWDQPATQFTESPGGSRRESSDLLDDQDLPEVAEKAPPRFSLFKRGGSLTSEGEKLRPSRYGAVRDSVPDEEEEFVASDPLGEYTVSRESPKQRRPRRERSGSFGGRIRNAFSVFSSSKYEGLGPLSSLGAPGDAPFEESAPPAQDGEETKFRQVHYTKRDSHSKAREEATATVTFSGKGVFIEEQPSGDYIDDIAPSVVKKFFVDPKSSSFNLLVSRRSSYATSPQSEYTITLVSKYFDFMMTCWKDIIRGFAEPPRDLDDVFAPHRRNSPVSPPGSHGHHHHLPPVFEDDEEFAPRSSHSNSQVELRSYGVEDNASSRKTPKYNPHSFSTSDLPPPPKHFYSPPPAKKDLLIDL